MNVQLSHEETYAGVRPPLPVLVSMLAPPARHVKVVQLAETARLFAHASCETHPCPLACIHVCLCCQSQRAFLTADSAKARALPASPALLRLPRRGLR